MIQDETGNTTEISASEPAAQPRTPLGGGSLGGSMVAGEEDDLLPTAGAAIGLVGILGMIAALLSRVWRRRKDDVPNLPHLPPKPHLPVPHAPVPHLPVPHLPVPSVDFKCRIGNIDYDQLMADPALFAWFKRMVIEWISRKTGAPEDCIEVTFRKGSVIIVARIKFPSRAAPQPAEGAAPKGASAEEGGSSPAGGDAESFAAAHAAAQLEDPGLGTDLLALVAEQPGFDALKEDPRTAFAISSVSVEEVADAPEKTRESESTSYGDSPPVDDEHSVDEYDQTDDVEEGAISFVVFTTSENRTEYFPPRIPQNISDAGNIPESRSGGNTVRIATLLHGAHPSDAEAGPTEADETQTQAIAGGNSIFSCAPNCGVACGRPCANAAEVYVAEIRQ